MKKIIIPLLLVFLITGQLQELDYQTRHYGENIIQACIINKAYENREAVKEPCTGCYANFTIYQLNNNEIVQTGDLNNLGNGIFGIEAEKKYLELNTDYRFSTTCNSTIYGQGTIDSTLKIQGLETESSSWYNEIPGIGSLITVIENGFKNILSEIQNLNTTLSTSFGFFEGYKNIFEFLKPIKNYILGSIEMFFYMVYTISMAYSNPTEFYTTKFIPGVFKIFLLIISPFLVVNILLELFILGKALIGNKGFFDFLEKIVKSHLDIIKFIINIFITIIETIISIFTSLISIVGVFT